MGSLVPGWDAELVPPRVKSHPETGPARHRLPHHEAPHKYTFTDWTEELTTLRSSLPHRSSSQGGHDDKHGSPGADKHGPAWWRALEVGHLNEQPDTEAAEQGAGAHHSTFVPQVLPQQRQQLDFGDRG
ncbi:hypothetical protein GPECTOR_1g747 [Gonium pectorale]|uniref:Uncharacterized protein n=1 Tax=Gonium pectorale TaxID=33097 RepID=A0A150H4Q6_GONPE|nr:hypothetical protein GPECTOR_1g747 [Gonium pectorale]|eukprot:KXZ56828.1 hypothetical protein GPECTOR_1g747 [Gonium pectorale]